MTLTTAVTYLKNFYLNEPGDIVTLEQIYLAGGRDLQEVEKNKMWLGNKMTPMKRFHLVKPIYKERRLTGLKLTDQGKIALGRKEPLPAPVLPEAKQIQVGTDVGDLLSQIEKLKNEHPHFHVTFSITPKEG